MSDNLTVEDTSLWRHGEDVEEIPVNGRIALYRSDMERALILNKTGSLLWKFLATPQSTHALIEYLKASFPTVTHQQAAHDVTTYLSELHQKTLINQGENHE